MADRLIIRKVKDHAVCVVVERRSPGEWDLPTAEFPWVRAELTNVTYYHRDGWEEAPPKPKAKKKGVTDATYRRMTGCLIFNK